MGPCQSTHALQHELIDSRLRGVESSSVGLVGPVGLVGLVGLVGPVAANLVELKQASQPIQRIYVIQPYHA